MKLAFHSEDQTASGGRLVTMKANVRRVLSLRLERTAVYTHTQRSRGLLLEVQQSLRPLTIKYMNIYEVIFWGSHGKGNAEDTIYLVRAPDFLAAVEDAQRNGSPSQHGTRSPFA